MPWHLTRSRSCCLLPAKIGSNLPNPQRICCIDKRFYGQILHLAFYTSTFQFIEYLQQTTVHSTCFFCLYVNVFLSKLLADYRTMFQIVTRFISHTVQNTSQLCLSPYDVKIILTYHINYQQLFICTICPIVISSVKQCSPSDKLDYWVLTVDYIIKAVMRDDGDDDDDGSTSSDNTERSQRKKNLLTAPSSALFTWRSGCQNCCTSKLQVRGS